MTHETDIQETVKIMLKGVAQHSGIDEITQKVKDSVSENRPLVIKLGLDPSAPDIHLGHAVVLRKIRQLQDMGHKAAIIIGDFTGMIGDPTGKSKARKQLDSTEVMSNAKTYVEQIYKILDESKTTVYYNSQWLGEMSFSDVIGLCSKCTVARILERDDFKNRYESNVSIGVHEFFYPLMQAYDSVMVKADIELGGTDQIFNILMGRNIQRDYNQPPQIGLFMPLLEGVDGVEKMSKSLGNYIGIYEDARDIFNKVMKIPDGSIINYYELCTDIHPDDIYMIKNELAGGVNPRDIKMKLAYEITSLYKGQDKALDAMENFKTIFQKQVAPDNSPVLKISESGESGLYNSLIDKIMETGKYKSKSDIRRLFQQGAVKLNGDRINNFDEIDNIPDNSILQIGKGDFFKILT